MTNLVGVGPREAFQHALHHQGPDLLHTECRLRLDRTHLLFCQLHLHDVRVVELLLVEHGLLRNSKILELKNVKNQRNSILKF